MPICLFNDLLLAFFKVQRGKGSEVQSYKVVKLCLSCHTEPVEVESNGKKLELKSVNFITTLKNCYIPTLKA